MFQSNRSSLLSSTLVENSLSGNQEIVILIDIGELGTKEPRSGLARSGHFQVQTPLRDVYKNKESNSKFFTKEFEFNLYI